MSQIITNPLTYLTLHCNAKQLYIHYKSVALVNCIILKEEIASHSLGHGTIIQSMLCTSTS